MDGCLGEESLFSFECCPQGATIFQLMDSAIPRHIQAALSKFNEFFWKKKKSTKLGEKSVERDRRGSGGKGMCSGLTNIYCVHIQNCQAMKTNVFKENHYNSLQQERVFLWLQLRTNLWWYQFCITAIWTVLFHYCFNLQLTIICILYTCLIPKCHVKFLVNFYFLRFIYIYLWVWVCLDFHLCTTCVLGVRRGQKEVLDALKQEL